MKYCVLLVLFSLFAQRLYCASSEAVELTAQLEEGDQWLKIDWTNKDGATLLCLGSIIGNGGISPAIQLFLGGRGKKAEKLINMDQPGAIGGRVEPFIIYMPHMAEFGIRINTRKLVLADHSKTVWDLRAQSWTLLARYQGLAPADTHAPPGSEPRPYNTLYSYPVEVHFWTGEAKAEVLHRAKNN